MTRLFLAKYIPDAKRWEPQNVGIFVVDGDRAIARFLGETDEEGKVDKRKAKFARDPNMYEDWVRYWRRMIAGRGEDALAEITKASTPNYWVTEAAEIWTGEEEYSLEDLVHRYYGKLVLTNDEQEDPAGVQLHEAVDQILANLTLPQNATFHRDIKVASNLVYEDSFTFHFGTQNGHTTVGQRVTLGSAMYVHDVLWRFAHVDVNRVALVAPDFEDEPHRAYIGALEEVGATVIDIGKDDAESLVADAFGE
jgi:hypothetical protein